MRFYAKEHPFCSGIDLHARSMYICVLDRKREPPVRQNTRAKPGAFLRAIAPYREGILVCVECVFTWYWLADLLHSTAKSEHSEQTVERTA